MKTFKKLAQITRMGPKDIFQQVNPRMVRDAYEHGMSLSAWMERLNPSDPNESDVRDAFGRVMTEANIFTRSIPSAGVYADIWDDAFDETPERRVLGLEWCRRQWLSVTNGGAVSTRPASPGTRAVQTSTEDVAGSAMRPYVDSARAITDRFVPEIPVSALVAITTPIPGDTYRVIYLQDVDPKQKRKVRVVEATEIPRVTLKASQHIVQLYKYGRVIEASYEVLRRERLDRIALQIALMAIQAENDKVATIIDVTVNGDGNAGTAAVSYDLTDLDPDTEPNVTTLESWLSFRLNFKSPYKMTALLARKKGILKAMLINTGTANVPLVLVQKFIGLGDFTLMGGMMSSLGDGVAYGNTDDAPVDTWVGVDTRFAIERVTEIGSEITEVERFATRQTQAIVMTETEGYGKLDNNATKLANLAA